jgi:hypothetical protein
MEYHFNKPINVDGTWKILCNHIMLEVTSIGTTAQQVKNLDIFPHNDWQEIIRKIKDRINSMPEETRRQYNKKSK